MSVTDLFEAVAVDPPPLRRLERPAEDRFWTFEPESKPEPCILIWDVERAPHRSDHYGIWDISINRTGLLRPAWIYCFAAKWRHAKDTEFHAVWHDPDWQTGDGDANAQLVETAWALLDAADVVVSFNGKRADTRWINNEFVRWEMDAPSDFKQIDLFQLGKRHFDLPFKGLDDLCQALGLEGKVDVGLKGMALYREAVEVGDPVARGKAEKYNIQDVIATEACLAEMEQRGWL